MMQQHSYYPSPQLHSGGHGNIIEMLEKRITALEAELEYIKKSQVQSHESFNIMICDIKKQREYDNNALSLLMASRIPAENSAPIAKKGVRLIETDSESSSSSDEDIDTNSTISKISNSTVASSKNIKYVDIPIIPQTIRNNKMVAGSSMANLGRDRRRAIL
jgi:hypothetical protein